MARPGAVRPLAADPGAEHDIRRDRVEPLREIDDLPGGGRVDRRLDRRRGVHYPGRVGTELGYDIQPDGGPGERGQRRPGGNPGEGGENVCDVVVMLRVQEVVDHMVIGGEG